MSRDIFVQDVPRDLTSVDEIPDGWEPSDLPFGHQDVVEAVRAVAPSGTVRDSDPEWLQVEYPGVDVEVNVANESPLQSFALHDRSADRIAVDRFVQALLDRLDARAFDPASPTGLFGG